MLYQPSDSQLPTRISGESQLYIPNSVPLAVSSSSVCFLGSCWSGSDTVWCELVRSLLTFSYASRDMSASQDLALNTMSRADLEIIFAQVNSLQNQVRDLQVVASLHKGLPFQVRGLSQRRSSKRQKTCLSPPPKCRCMLWVDSSSSSHQRSSILFA